MITSHTKALQSFARDLQWLLALRLWVQMSTGWLFLWGTVVLALRFWGMQSPLWLTMGLGGVVPLLALAAWQAKRRRAAFTHLRANYDRLNACGGIIMAEEAADMGPWTRQLPNAAVPRLRWRSGRALFLLGLSALFAATALLLPEKLAHFAGHRPLEIGQVLGQLEAEVNTLKEERILDDKKAQDLQKQLSQLQKDAAGYDPDKTWEALDHIKKSNSDQAQQAAEEALTKTDALAQAETMAKGMEMAAGAGMNETTATQAAQDLASMLNEAKLEDGLLNGRIPPELLAGLNGLNKEQMEKLLRALELSKSSLGRTLTNLAHLRLIDPAMLGKCDHAGQCHNTNALAEYLSSCTNGCSAAECEFLCRGGAGAPMTWTEGSSEKDLKFQEHALPPASQLSEAQLVGVSKAAPELSGNDVAAQPGALDSAAGSGGAANLQTVLPEQRQAVRHFFKRDD